MSVTLHLAPEIERRLSELAASNGQTLESYLEQLAERAARGANGTLPEGQPHRTFDEILAPVRQGFAESGLTDDELKALFEEAREEVWREKPRQGDGS